MYWRNDCAHEFSEEGDCGWVYEDADDWSEYLVSYEEYEQWNEEFDWDAYYSELDGDNYRYDECDPTW